MKSILLPSYDHFTDQQLKAARVSTILSHCERFEFSDVYRNWKKRKELEDKEKDPDELAQELSPSKLGTYVHSCLEKASLGKNYLEYINTKVDEKYRQSVQDRINLYIPFTKIYQPLITEGAICVTDCAYNGKAYHYRGTLDGCGLVDTSQIVDNKGNKVLKNPRILCDYKNYSKCKSPPFLVRTQLQLAAYSYGLSTTSEYTVYENLLVTTTKKKLTLWHMDWTRLQFFVEEWLSCLEYYYNNWKYDWEHLLYRIGVNGYKMNPVNLGLTRVYLLSEKQQIDKYLKYFQKYLNPSNKYEKSNLLEDIDSKLTTTKRFLSKDQLQALTLLKELSEEGTRNMVSQLIEVNFQ